MGVATDATIAIAATLDPSERRRDMDQAGPGWAGAAARAPAGGVTPEGAGAAPESAAAERTE